MTNSEIIIEDMRPYPVRLSLVRRKCLKYGLIPEGNVSDEKTIARIVIELLTQMMTLNNIGEGGVNISFNKAGVESYIRSLCSEHGFDDDFTSKPTVTYLGDL